MASNSILPLQLCPRVYFFYDSVFSNNDTWQLTSWWSTRTQRDNCPIWIRERVGLGDRCSMIIIALGSFLSLSPSKLRHHNCLMLHHSLGYLLQLLWRM